MTYCTNAELTLLTGTTLSTAIQDAMITQSDREIKARITAADLTPPAADDMLKAASLNLSTVKIITYNRITPALMDRTQTKSVKVGDITLSDDPDKAIAALAADAWQSVDAYIASETAAAAAAKTWVRKVN